MNRKNPCFIGVLLKNESKMNRKIVVDKYITCPISMIKCAINV